MVVSLVSVVFLILVKIGINEGKQTRPNFLILFADDMGYGDTSYNGHPSIRTPNIDGIAHEGMVFTQWYSAFHVCSPSRASLMTGRLPPRTGCAGPYTGGVFPSGAVSGFPSNEITFADQLKKVGYRTGIIGKWHLGQRKEYWPFNRGFDDYLGIPFSVDMGLTPWSPNGKNSPVLPLIDNDTIIEQPVDLSKLSAKYAQRADQFIRESVEVDQAPFALYVPFSHVHTPDFTSIPFCNSSARGRYGDAMEEMDGLIGEIMASLKTYNVDNDTLTFFTSDNGPWLIMRLAGGSASLFRSGKQTTWEGGIRMPAAVRWPGHIEGGSRTLELASTMDIFPTILKLANATIPSDRIIDGNDLAPILFENGHSAHECLYIYGGTPGNGTAKDGTNCNGDYVKCPGLYALRCGKYKMHWLTKDYNASGNDPTFHDPPLLFNVEWDPSELHPIYPNNVAYPGLRSYFEEKKAQHEATYIPVTNYIMLGNSDSDWPCCDWNSQEKYPQYPVCTCNPENWSAFTCTPTCLDYDNCGPSVEGAESEIAVPFTDDDLYRQSMHPFG